MGVEWELLAGLGESDRRDVLAGCVRRRFPRGQAVFHEGELGDSLHLLASGRVAVRVSAELGDQLTLAVRGPGDFFGEQALVSSSHRRSAAVTALEPVETLVLTRDRFAELRASHPSVDDLLIVALDARLREMSARLAEALFTPADKRVLRRLVALAELYGSGSATTVPLTQDDLASMAGTTRPTANRVLRNAESLGILGLARGRTDVRDLDGLRRLAR